MMQQTTPKLLGTQEELEELQQYLRTVLQENRLPQEILRLQRNKNTASLFLRSELICRFSQKGKGLSGLCISRQFAPLLPAWAAEGRVQGEMLFFDFEPSRRLTDWFPALGRVCEQRIGEIPKQFDCCHRYEECSDAGHCTNPDLFYAMECGYRRFLRQGRIFYGKNRNVDEGGGWKQPDQEP